MDMSLLKEIDYFVEETVAKDAFKVRGKTFETEA